MSHEDEIRRETGRLAQMKGDGPAAFARREEEVSRKRLDWWDANRKRFNQRDWVQVPLLDRAYRIFYLEYLGLDPAEVPIVERSAHRLVVRSANFCPVHPACEALGLDTREVCRVIYERPVTDLLRRIDPRLHFGRNYQAIRPYAAYCEELIEVTGGGEGYKE